MVSKFRYEIVKIAHLSVGIRFSRRVSESVFFCSSPTIRETSRLALTCRARFLYGLPAVQRPRTIISSTIGRKRTPRHEVFPHRRRRRRPHHCHLHRETAEAYRSSSPIPNSVILSISTGGRMTSLPSLLWTEPRLNERTSRKCCKCCTDIIYSLKSMRSRP